MTTNDNILLAETEPSIYQPIADGSLASMSTSKLLDTWRELDANGRKTKKGFPVDLSNLENAIRVRVARRLLSFGFQLVY